MRTAPVQYINKLITVEHDMRTAPVQYINNGRQYDFSNWTDNDKFICSTTFR